MSVVDHLPYFTQGPVVSGFGRGGKDLGIPTANLPNEVVNHLPEAFECGVYYGWASVDGLEGVHQVVLSLGYNVYFGSEVKTLEVHIMHKFDTDFYGKNLRVVILGFIRPMTNFNSLDELISAINNDILEANQQLEKINNLFYKSHSFFFPTTTATSITNTETNQSDEGCRKNHRSMQHSQNSSEDADPDNVKSKANCLHCEVEQHRKCVKKDCSENERVASSSGSTDFTHVTRDSESSFSYDLQIIPSGAGATKGENLNISACSKCCCLRDEEQSLHIPPLRKNSLRCENVSVLLIT